MMTSKALLIYLHERRNSRKFDPPRLNRRGYTIGFSMAESEVKFTSGGMLGLVLGSACGVIGGVFGPFWGAWEDGKATGEMLAVQRIENDVSICKGMLGNGPLNDIQRDYCAELIAKALGEIE